MKKDVDYYINESDKYFEDQDWSKSIESLLKAWSSIPEPKFVDGESYHVAKYLIDLYITINDLDNAEEWSGVLQKCGLKRYDDGEREFFEGKVKFEKGNLNDAKKLFVIANKKSKGRCFIDEEKKYKQLILQ